MTYKTIQELVENNNHSGIYQNEFGELVTIQHKNNDGEDRFEIITNQNNGRTRINIFWKDGTIETLFTEVSK